MITFELFCEENYSHAFVMAPSASLGLNNTLNVPTNAYGFWVNKWGHWIEVPSYGHANGASELISKYSNQSGEDIQGMTSVYNTLYRHGYIRIVIESRYNRIYWGHTSNNFTPTQSQQKFLNELERVYNLPVERDHDNTSED